ncbi:signal transduction histidine kinase [Natranaerovirga pectinivora]|uniref:histidine kinase n=1 Tax=Natranaerovirga pectinivora TaxID=682400 RepID=A0A4R3MPD4_9FIRM|nr:histidine kinase [Natranaerovirga pectinivora]TCT16131.1 signal transduction histidine kinase [Natranaerovirga pectinivora]
MNDNETFISPEIYGTIYRLIGVILLCLLWIRTDSTIVGFFFTLFIVNMMLLRWRFNQLHWTLIIDVLVCISVSVIWPYGLYGLVLIVFNTLFINIGLLVLPIAIYVFVQGDYPLMVMLIQSLFVGFLLEKWKAQKNKDLAQIDFNSQKRRELESLKDELLTANIQVARMAEVSERSRISREIHDNAGHEIIAAYMSLQVIESLIDNDSKEIKEMFKESIKRLEMGIEKIRYTVHDLTPLTEVGIECLNKLCSEFTFCPIEFKVFGDSSKVPIYLWNILEPCLKEALTNIMKHSMAKKVNVTLDITPYIVRLCVENNGIKNNKDLSGIGLRNLRHRVGAVGGNISTDTSDGFRLICVLPIEPKGGFL